MSVTINGIEYRFIEKNIGACQDCAEIDDIMLCNRLPDCKGGIFVSVSGAVASSSPVAEAS